MIYPETISRVGYRYNDAILIPTQENKKYQKLLKEGGVLPEGIFAYGHETGDASTTEFYTVYETDLTETEIAEYLTYRKLGMQRYKYPKNSACFLYFA